MVLLLVLLAVNCLIATWNAWVVGKMWDLADGFFAKLVLWSALVQSVVGYSSAILLGVVTGLYYNGRIDEHFIVLAVDFWYVLVIFPALGTLLVLWLHSIQMAFRHPGILSWTTAGWNTYAMAHNVGDALQHLPEASEGAGELFSSIGKGEDGWKVWLVILVVLASIGLGALLTWAVFALSRRSAGSLAYDV